MALDAGQRLLHYRLIEKIGEGGMGVVWKAEDTKLQRRVALKVLPEALAADPDRRARFEREARAVAALNHPNIVTLHSVEEAETSAGSVHFITMELVEGQTLTRLLPRSGLSLNQLLEIAIPLANAVSRAHRAGITHRDLKPDNIMIDRENRLRVLDFGLAKLAEPSGTTLNTQVATVTSDTAEGRVLGTVAYMSPEQAEGKEVDSRSDIFSLGTILYEMASGVRPFRGDTRMSTIGAILRGEPASITELSPSLPRDAGRIIRRCLAKDPDRRYQTALDLRNELEDLKIEVDSGVHAGGALPATNRSAWSTRRWIVLGVATVLTVAVFFQIRQWVRWSPDPKISYAAVPMTAEIGLEAWPNWSPEGEFIAFSQVRHGNNDIMVKPVAGGEAEVRADGPGDELGPRWSPDGRYLAYMSTSEPGDTFIYLVQPHGGTPRRLIETGLGSLHDVPEWGDRPWARDSRTLLVSRTGDLRRLAIYRVDRDNGAAEQLSFPPEGSDDTRATYSFDGQRIAFQRGGPTGSRLMMMPAAGGDPEPLQTDADASSPAFRPDGRHLLFLATLKGATQNLWELDLATRTAIQVTSESRHMVLSFTVSAANRIAYQAFWHDTFLFVIDVTTGERRQLTWHTQDNYNARFSPDGGAIAYVSTRTGNEEVFLFHLDGSPETQVTDDPNRDVSLDWSPDGRELLVLSSREDDRPKLFIVNRDGGNWRRLVDQASTTAAPSSGPWSPDGKRIAYIVAGETPSLWTIGPDGTGAKQVIRDAESFDWYRDSRHGIYTRRRGTQSEMIVVDFETGEERSLFVGTLTEMDVAPDGSAVAFCAGPGHMSMGLALLKLEPPAGPRGFPRVVGEPGYVVRAEDGWHVHNGGWSPDSRSLVYTQDQDYGDIYELVERR